MCIRDRNATAPAASPQVGIDRVMFDVEDVYKRQTLFRNGLRTLLDGIEGFSVIGEASNGVELLELLPGIEPDVILLDIEMPKMNGIVTAEEALKRYPDLKIITLSMYGDEDYYFKMVSLGVKGFILKNSEIKEVAAAIETVVGGGSYRCV